MGLFDTSFTIPVMGTAVRSEEYGQLWPSENYPDGNDEWNFEFWDGCAGREPVNSTVPVRCVHRASQA
jgi:hypothetical protein